MIPMDWNPFLLPQDLSGMNLLFISNHEDGFRLYATDTDSGETRPLTVGQTFFMSWSPDGTQAVFTADPITSGNDIFWTSSDGSIVRNLTANGRDNTGPMWSPDGTQIAFGSLRDAPAIIEARFTYESLKRIYVMDADGANPHPVVPPEAQPQPYSAEMLQGWTSDGRIVFTSRRDSSGETEIVTHIYSVRADGSDLINLTLRAGLNLGHGTDIFWVDVSPVGSQIAFIVARNREADLYVMNADGSNLRQLTQGSRVETSPRWSPDGLRLAFVGDTFQTDSVPPDIYVINADGSGEYNLTATVSGWKEDPRWSADGAQLAFVNATDNQRDIYVVRNDGADPQLIVPSDNLQFGPRWLPASTTNAP